MGGASKAGGLVWGAMRIKLLHRIVWDQKSWKVFAFKQEGNTHTHTHSELQIWRTKTKTCSSKNHRQQPRVRGPRCSWETQGIWGLLAVCPDGGDCGSPLAALCFFFLLSLFGHLSLPRLILPLYILTFIPWVSHYLQHHTGSLHSFDGARRVGGQRNVLLSLSHSKNLVKGREETCFTEPLPSVIFHVTRL